MPAFSSSSSHCSKRSKTVSTPHLPLDLQSEILCRLYVKHLLQLCCVCKSWNSLISLDSYFARKQLTLSTSNKDRHHLIQSSCKSYREFILSHSPISSFFTSDSIVPVKQLSHTIKRIINNRRRGVKISTCDGILCFAISGSLAVLYNPFIRKSKKLPPLKTPKPQPWDTLYTLVYDPITRNYKIIAIVVFGNSKIEANIHILGTDYWRRIQDFPCSHLICRPGIFVNNTLNWLAFDINLPRVIVSLDLEKESYQKLSLPFHETHFESLMSLGVLRGCMFIFSRCHELSHVWIMKEYGNEKSWTKLLSIPLIEECSLYGAYLKALYISENDQLLMEFYGMDKCGLVVYDSINNTFNIPKMQNNIHNLKVTSHFYVESLISPF